MIKHALATIEHSAVGNHAMGINAALENRSIPVTTYAETIRSEYTQIAHPIGELNDTLDEHDVVLYQFANPSPMADLLLNKKCRVIVNYHNITPAHYFAKWNPPTASAISRARTQLARLAPIASAAIAVSDYNAAELHRLGYRNIEVIPPVFSDHFFTSHSDTARSPGRWLFVGRIAPHKNIHLLLHALDFYRRHYDTNATLKIIGSSDTPLYDRAIHELIVKRELLDAVTIISNASIRDLGRAYREAEIFVSASEHEGFCVPLIEAMASGLPVVALDAAAVGVTCGSSAVLYTSADGELIAKTVDSLVGDDIKMNELVQRGYARAQRYHPHISAEKYADYLQGWLS